MGDVTAESLVRARAIRSHVDALIERRFGSAPSSREHRYVGGPPPLRIYRMQIAHEGRARRARVPWDTVDLRVIYRRDSGVCGICQTPVSVDEFTIDRPLSAGGPHLPDNLQVAHASCNSAKGDRWPGHA